MSIGCSITDFENQENAVELLDELIEKGTIRDGEEVVREGRVIVLIPKKNNPKHDIQSSEALAEAGLAGKRGFGYFCGTFEDAAKQVTHWATLTDGEWDIADL